MAGKNKHNWTAVVIYVAYHQESRPDVDIYNDAKALQDAHQNYGQGCFLAQTVGELQFFRKQGLVTTGTKLYILGHMSDDRKIGPFAPQDLARVLKLCGISRVGRISFVSCFAGAHFKGQRPYAQEFREALEAADGDLKVQTVDVRDGIYGRIGEVMVAQGGVPGGAPRGSKSVIPPEDSSNEDDEDPYPDGVIPKGQNKLRF